MDIIGLTVLQATKKLKEQGIKKVVVTDNFIKPLPNSTLLVTSCKILDGVAHLCTGSFKLDL